ncbi:MAG: ATP-binding protein [Pirellula sp.]
MQSLPRSKVLPESVTLEKPATALASLTTTDAMRVLSDSVISQWKRVAVFERLSKHGIYPIRNVLMYGPPGNGKTTACQWLAGCLDAPLYRVRCEALVSSALGGSAKSMHETMQFLANAGKSVVLFDEVESIFPSRANNDDSCSRELASSMTVFWQMIDRWTSPQLFCYATNMPETLDPALMSRFELKLQFDPPTPEQKLSVLEYWSEVLHEFSPDLWASELAALEYESFRELWQCIADRVRHIAISKE